MYLGIKFHQGKFVGKFVFLNMFSFTFFYCIYKEQELYKGKWKG